MEGKTHQIRIDLTEDNKDLVHTDDPDNNVMVTSTLPSLRPPTG